MSAIPEIQEVEALELEWTAAINAACQGNSQQIESFLNDHLHPSYSNPSSPGGPRDKTKEIADYPGWINSLQEVAVPVLSSRVQGNLVVVDGSDVVTLKGSATGDGFTWTDTWVKVNDVWQCLSHHGSKSLSR